MLFEELQAQVEDWAQAKGLLKKENVSKQFLKVIEEIGELSSAIARNDEQETIDAIGDTFVTLIILSAQLGYDPVACLDVAHDEIKDRTGKTVNGVFIKD
jgi:NTP pyrophosphatase (non-canonical NTP hydrolase)